ncbi:hypothetical protein [Hymenobacter swuensis]|uniref:Uncharacterized protein n=1 Tax=Hymenobacter swuensis DY53 TaxID=1227739 RepID=W8ESP8_9BACT|nr:hypothetical protein [Hymenobacter swuensis]AHJ95548.1 hypothetical protein Hsw_PA0215 [Hymenobacter swuensis DY53]
MNFSVYDVLSKLLPGGILFCVVVLGQLVPKSDRLTDVLSLVIMYLLGYFIDATASSIEPMLFTFMGGRPSARLIQDQYEGRYRLSRLPVLIQHMQQTFPEQFADRSLWFDLLARTVNQKAPPRVTTFQEAYAFARNLSVSLCLSLPLVQLAFHSWYLTAAVACLCVLAFRRTKERAYYYVRELINCYMHEKCP